MSEEHYKIFEAEYQGTFYMIGLTDAEAQNPGSAARRYIADELAEKNPGVRIKVPNQETLPNSNVKAYPEGQTVTRQGIINTYNNTRMGEGRIEKMIREQQEQEGLGLDDE